MHRHLEQTGHAVVTADDGSSPFSRAGSRNQAVAHAALDEVVILHDADMIAPPHAYSTMFHLADTTGRVVIGYSEYRALNRPTTSRVLDGADPFTEPPVGTTREWSVGGIIAVRRDAWDHVGGMDTRFRGWGCEDFAFCHAAAVILGPIERISTPAVHLWHPSGLAATDPHLVEQNSRLMAAYTACGTEAEIRSVQACGS